MRFTFAILASLCLASHSLAQSDPPAAAAGQAQAGAARPRIVFKSPEHHFGQIFDEGKVECDIEFTNEGDAELVITGMTSTCGCTIPSLNGVSFQPDQAKTARIPFQPGEVGKIRVAFNPLGKQDEVTQSVTVSSNDPERPQVEIAVKAFVEPRVRVDPRAWNIGDVPRGQVVEQVIKVYGRTPDFKVMHVTTPGIDEGMKIKIGAPKEVEMRGEKVREVEIVATYTATGKPAKIGGTASIRTNDPKRRLVSTSVLGRIVGVLSLDHQRFSLGSIKPGEKATHVLRLTNLLGNPFTVAGISFDGNFDPESPPTYEIIPVDPQKRDAYDIKATFTGNKAVGAMKGKALIHTDVPDEQEFEVSIFGTVSVGSGH